MDSPPDVTERGARAGVPSLLADPKLHFESDAAQQASRALVSSILARKGIVVLEAAPGLGKTHALLRLTQGGHLVFRSAYLRVREHDLNGLRARVARALALDAGAAGRHGAQAFNSALLTLRKEGSTAVLALDDAHRLSDEVLAALPALSPREPTTGGALLQIVLAAPPGFGERLERAVLEPLRERVAEIVPLSGLEPPEVGPFLEQRLAGTEPDAEWSETTVEAIAIRP